MRRVQPGLDQQHVALRRTPHAQQVAIGVRRLGRQQEQIGGGFREHPLRLSAPKTRATIS